MLFIPWLQPFLNPSPHLNTYSSLEFFEVIPVKNIIIITLAIVAVFAVGCTQADEQQEQINSFEDCVNAGNPVMESYPRQCSANGQTFVEEIQNEIPEMSQDYCEQGGGNWNECSSKCMLDNQGREGVACTLQCEALCECGGIAGFSCPEGYYCHLPETQIVDALGYCVKELGKEEARVIAESSNCTSNASIIGEGSYNSNSKTWWFDLDIEKQGCNPSCVVSAETGNTEINWRCTGLLPD